ncbi:hypothetical protein J1605_009600 [Eschrichtius robustus]|uniref:Peptidase M14 domain-containing protein n=1 Tax=Eschrichtius robustus TaxID=9764 RepID=A0AB34GVK7_ESCRO|nr:hypothetical protein J1605_009600 [Eschrichtius robustus]
MTTLQKTDTRGKKDQVFRINVRNGDEISKLSQLVNSDNFKLNFWKSPSTFGHPVDVLFPSVSLQPVKSFLKSQGLEYLVTVEDLQALLDNEDEEMQYNEGQERSSNNFNYRAYHSLEAIYHEIDSIARDFPDLASRVKIGHLFENRSMYVLKFSTGEGRQQLTIWLNSGEGASDNPCSEVYHGAHASSEVEVKLVVDFIQERGNFKCFIDLHSYSQLLTYPCGYMVKKAPDADELDEVARCVAKALASLSGTEYQVCPTCTTVYPASGSSVDWAYDNGIKYAFTFELRDIGHYGFFLPANQIIPTTEETWLGLKTIMEHVWDNLS